MTVYLMKFVPAPPSEDVCVLGLVTLCCVGVMNQHGMVSPPVTSQQQLGSVGSMPRLPVPLDQLSNSSHHNSAAVALVKPVPQQASPIRVC